jgi:hypothetical protein
MTNNNQNIDNDEVDDVIPLKSNNINNVNNVESSELPDLSQIDMSKMGDMMDTLKNKNPSDLLRMMRNMGISDGQIEQMKKQYKNGNLTDHSQEPDIRKRFRAKMNEMRTMRNSNSIKQQYIEKIQEEKGAMAASVNPVAIELSKKTLANRKKAQKKKEKKAEMKQLMQNQEEIVAESKDSETSDVNSDVEEIIMN